MISGPRQLAAYHAAQLALEAQKAGTMHDHIEDEEALTHGNAGLAAINLGNTPLTGGGQPLQYPTVDAPLPPPPPGYHYGTRGASKGKLLKDVVTKDAAPAPKPPAPEPGPVSALLSDPETCQQRYNRLTLEVYQASQFLRELRRELEQATADLVL